MGVKVYISRICGNKEVKKRQQRVMMILDSKCVKYDIIDIADPGNEEKKKFMQTNSTASGGTISDPSPRYPLPPQIFNDEAYCGDYDQFDLANEKDEIEKFLHLALGSEPTNNLPIVISDVVTAPIGNGVVHDHNESENNDIIKNEEPQTNEIPENNDGNPEDTVQNDDLDTNED